MNRDEAKQEIRKEWKRLYPADKSGKGIVCPICGSGSGPKGTGIRENPHSETPGALKCFACGFSGDVLALMQQERGLSFPEAIDEAARALNIRIDADPGRGHTEAARREPAQAREEHHAQRNTQQRAQDAPQAADFTAYYRECSARLADHAAVSYLAGRGISLETAAAAGVGFDPEADPANAPGAGSGERKPHPAPRLIFPAGGSFYTGRRIDGGEEYRYSNPVQGRGAGKAELFNKAALYAAQEAPVFVTEGAMDALSILEAGAAAVALNSVSNAALLLKVLEAEPTRSTLILYLDHDNAGKKATAELAKGLQRLNISYVISDIGRSAKDPNEALTADKAKFAAEINAAIAQTARPDNVARYIADLMGGEIDSFKEAKDRKTGFANLDTQTGGLYAGLYCIAAISSLGKTTFSHQVADQIAAAGEEVIFFSMEQSRLEMVSKSLSRITAQRNISKAVDSLSIRRGYLPENVLKAADDYTAAVGERLSIVEGNFNCDISFIGDYIRQYIRRTGKKPVVFIDYLQILQPGEGNQKQQRREVIDSAVTELKRISREHGLTVFIISSVNRANYLSPIDFESLKESGGIEYTCDVIWGLQLQCLNDPLFDGEKHIKEKRERVREAKDADPRKIELVCLKNRYGRATFSCLFDYYPKYDLFIPGEAPEPESKAPKRKRI